MSKKCYRFFGGLLTVQKNWLNNLSGQEECSMNLKNVSQVKFNIAWSL